MADHSTIEWTDATWNPITGCSILSPGCTHCYAMKLAGTRLRNHPSRAGLTTKTKAGPVWNGKVRFNEEWLTQPLVWRKPKMVFVCAHGDLFHEDVPDEWIDRVFAVMALAPQHSFQVLTKRPERMRRYISECSRLLGRQSEIRAAISAVAGGRDAPGVTDAWLRVSGGPSEWKPLVNVWLGVSAEDQPRYDQRAGYLRATPAAVRFFSMEPLLGPIIAPWLADLVILGGENGSRPMHPDWARSLRDQCEDAGVPFFFKQWGSWEVALDRERDDPDWRADYSREFADGGKHKWLNLAGGCGFHGERFHVMRNVGKKAAGRLLDGVEYNGMPEVAMRDERP